MDEKELKNLAEQCNLYDSSDSVSVIQKITALEENFDDDAIVQIYNYFLSVTKCPDVMMFLIKSLDRYRNPSSLSVLLDVLLLKNIEPESNADKEAYINARALCTKAIANMKDTSAVTPLLYCLNNKDENYKVRLACADALGKIGDKYAVAPLIDVVQDEGEKSVYLRESAASALGMLGDLRAVDPLVSILETKRGILDKFTFLKERVIEALGKLRLNDNERVFHALKNSLADESPQIRINAIEAIMDSDHPEAYEIIYDCLQDKDDDVKKNALIALYNMRGRRILDEVLASPDFPDVLKFEAAAIIEEYEEDNDALSEAIREELDD